MGQGQMGDGPDAGEGTVMGAAAFAVALVVLAVGGFLGWHANRTSVANDDVKTAHRRIAGHRRTRLRSGLIALVMIIVTVFVVVDLAHS